jgi:hypothetical protein
MKVVKEGDEYVVRILDEAGSPRSNGAGGWLDADGYVAELKGNANYAAAFASESKGGGGHRPNSAGGAPPARKSGELSSTDKIAAGLGKGEYTKSGQGAIV